MRFNQCLQGFTIDIILLKPTKKPLKTRKISHLKHSKKNKKEKSHCITLCCYVCLCLFYSVFSLPISRIKNKYQPLFIPIQYWQQLKTVKNHIFKDIIFLHIILTQFTQN